MIKKINYKHVLTAAALFVTIFYGVVAQKPAQAVNKNVQTSSLESVENVWFVSSTKEKVKISWVKVTNADTYEIQVLDSNETLIQELTSDNNKVTIQDLVKKTQYFVQVRAVNSTEGTYSDWSEQIKVFTKPYQGMKNLPVGIKDDTLPQDVRMYKNPNDANAAGAIQLAMGDLYTVLSDYVQEYTENEAASRVVLEKSLNSGDWFKALAHYTREKGKQNAEQVKKDEKAKSGHSTNDPHIQTFDGLKYDSQARGVFWLVKDSQEKFSVQVVQRYLKDLSNASYNSGVAIQVGGRTLEFNLESVNPVSLDGIPLAIVEKRAVVWPGVILMRNGNEFILITDEDQNLFLKLESTLNPEITVNQTRSERYSGLLGNANDIPYDDLSIDSGMSRLDEIGEKIESLTLKDFVTNDATVYQMSGDQFYEDYIEPWSTTLEDSFFAESDYIEYFPPLELITLDDFSNQEIEKTKAECLLAAGVETSSSLYACVYDHLAGGMSVSDLAPFMKRTDGKVEPSAWLDLM